MLRNTQKAFYVLTCREKKIFFGFPKSVRMTNSSKKKISRNLADLQWNQLGGPKCKKPFVVLKRARLLKLFLFNIIYSILPFCFFFCFLLLLFSFLVYSNLQSTFMFL